MTYEVSQNDFQAIQLIKEQYDLFQRHDELQDALIEMDNAGIEGGEEMETLEAEYHATDDRLEIINRALDVWHKGGNIIVAMLSDSREPETFKRTDFSKF
jgi:hypothetical protein